MLAYLFCVITLCLLSTHANGQSCAVNIGIPIWYEPEYEFVSVLVDVLTTVTTVTDGEESLSPEDNQGELGLDYGAAASPPSANAHSTTITDPDGANHQVNHAFNGTHVCVGYNHIKRTDDGGSVQHCRETCVAAFNTSSQTLLYYESNGTSPAVLGHLIVRTSRGNAEIALTCYTRLEPYSDDSPPQHKFPGSVDYCPLGEKCTVTVARKAASSPLLYYARCQPNNTDICESQGCRQNTAAPSVGEGMYHSVCDWCCGFNQCNNIKNCTQDACHFYGAPVVEEEVEESEDDDGQGGTGDASRLSLSVWVRFLLTTATFRLWLFRNP